MAERSEPLFDAPIPGMSLTAELGGRPWQNPSQYTTVDEAIEYYLDRMSSDEFNQQLVEIMEAGIPLTTLANTIQMASVMDGKHNIDVGMLVIPVLIEMMRLVGDSAGIDYNVGIDNPEKDLTRSSLLAKVSSKIKKELSEEKTEKETEEPEDTEEVETKGLMARRAK
jgi:hypothetical protein